MIILKTESTKDYELLDSGNGEKLERFGQFVLARPDPQALWSKRLSEKEWNRSNAVFLKGAETKWKNKNVPEKWEINLSDLTFSIRLGKFKHPGVFPEQAPNWEWMENLIKGKKNIRVLNLFGYTGGATLACLKAGAEVTHVDASRVAVTQAKENAELSGLSDKPVRWILDDALTFIKREIKRGNKYDGIIMDPPAFGRGPKGEIWKIEDAFIDFVEKTKELLSNKPLFYLINGYASGYSALAYEENIRSIHDQFGGEIESGELAIVESESGRLLPAGIFASWSASKK